MIFDEAVENLTMKDFIYSHKVPKKKVKRLTTALERYASLRFYFAKRDYGSYLYHPRIPY